MRLAFAGTPEFARTALAALVSAGFDVALVLSQPDRPAGRGQRTAASAVKAFACTAGLEVATPAGLRLDGRHAAEAAAARASLERAGIDVLVVAAYGLILPPWLLALPRHGCLNIHASLLPRWRGAAPIQRAIEAGDAATGVTIMQMDAGLDTGAILACQAMPIDPSDTAASLQGRLAGLGAEMIVGALHELERGPLVGQMQPADGVTYAAKIAKSEAVVDWQAPAPLIERRLRAFDPFPGARSALADQLLTLWRGRVVADGQAMPAGRPRVAPGTLVGGAESLTVVCGEGCLAIDELQRAGGRRLPAAEFLRGWQPPAGAAFRAPATART